MLVTVDTGGTKTLVASFKEDGTIDTSVKFPTPHDQDEYVKVLTELLKNDFSADIDAISVAAPAVIEDGVILKCSNLPWKNLRLVDELNKQFNCPVLLANDAKLAALAETHNFDEFPELCLYVTVSTGIGIGVTAKGELVPELLGSEAGRMILERHGEMRDWESFASGKAIYETYGKYASEIDDEAAWETIADNIARGLLVLIPTIEPDVVVIGGSIGTHFAHYGSRLVEIIEKQLPDLIGIPQIVQAKHPEEAVIYGCYYNAIDHLAH